MKIQFSLRIHYILFPRTVELVAFKIIISGKNFFHGNWFFTCNHKWKWFDIRPYLIVLPVRLEMVSEFFSATQNDFGQEFQHVMYAIKSN